MGYKNNDTTGVPSNLEGAFCGKENEIILIKQETNSLNGFLVGKGL